MQRRYIKDEKCQWGAGRACSHSVDALAET